MPRTRSALAFLHAAVIFTLVLPSLVMTPPASAARERRCALPDQWTMVAAAPDWVRSRPLTPLWDSAFLDDDALRPILSRLVKD